MSFTIIIITIMILCSSISQHNLVTGTFQEFKHFVKPSFFLSQQKKPSFVHSFENVENLLFPKFFTELYRH